MLKWPKLSETLTPVVDLFTCQNCGKRDDHDLPPRRWQECDDNDQPTPVVVMLCRDCAGRIVEPHPRLYKDLSPEYPLPGAMPVCESCIHRKGVLCGHHNLIANGGPGLALRFPKPTIAFIDGVKDGKAFGGPLFMGNGAVSCEGQELWHA